MATAFPQDWELKATGFKWNIMVGLYQAAFRALADGTAATEVPREVPWEQLHDTLQNKVQHKKGAFSGGCPKKSSVD